MVCDRRKFPKAEMLPLTREEMINIVNQCRSESLWNRFFSEYKQFRNIKEKIDICFPFISVSPVADKHKIMIPIISINIYGT